MSVKLKRFAGVTVVVMVALLTFTPVVQGGIAGTAHDFSADGWSGGELCAPCHTPHGADSAITDAPLWNHTVSAATYTIYTSTTLNATLGQPNGISKLCLSCHDGTVAVDSFGGATGSTFIVDTDSEYVGTDLSGSHPISFSFDTALATADGGLYDPSTQNSGLGGTISADLLFADQLECGSCHDVHAADGYSNLLRLDNAGSALCLTCHDK